jgi:hypothetical protein
MLAAFIFGDKGYYHDLVVEHHVNISRTGNRHSLCKTALSFETAVNDAEKCGFDDFATNFQSLPFQLPALLITPTRAHVGLVQTSRSRWESIHSLYSPPMRCLPTFRGGRWVASKRSRCHHLRTRGSLKIISTFLYEHCPSLPLSTYVH